MLDIPKVLPNFVPNVAHECGTYIITLMWVPHPCKTFGKNFEISNITHIYIICISISYHNCAHCLYNLPLKFGIE